MYISSLCIYLCVYVYIYVYIWSYFACRGVRLICNKHIWLNCVLTGMHILYMNDNHVWSCHTVLLCHIVVCGKTSYAIWAFLVLGRTGIFLISRYTNKTISILAHQASFGVLSEVAAFMLQDWILSVNEPGLSFPSCLANSTQWAVVRVLRIKSCVTLWSCQICPNPVRVRDEDWRLCRPEEEVKGTAVIRNCYHMLSVSLRSGLTRLNFPKIRDVKLLG